MERRKEGAKLPWVEDILLDVNRKFHPFNTETHVDPKGKGGQGFKV